MNKFVFYFGTMGSAKTANALMLRFQYIQNKKFVLLIKPSIDNRDDDADGTTKIKSRIGLEAPAMIIKPDENIYETYAKMCSKYTPDVIICDEAQFFTPVQVEQLRDLCTNMKVDIICFGLRTDFQTNAFPGAQRLFELADEFRQLDAICNCGEPAIVNARFDSSGQLITKGAQVAIGGDDMYKPLCWRCYRRHLNLGGKLNGSIN